MGKILARGAIVYPRAVRASVNYEACGVDVLDVCVAVF